MQKTQSYFHKQEKGSGTFSLPWIILQITIEKLFESNWRKK